MKFEYHSIPDSHSSTDTEENWKGNDSKEEEYYSILFGNKISLPSSKNPDRFLHNSSLRRFVLLLISLISLAIMSFVALMSSSLSFLTSSYIKNNYSNEFPTVYVKLNNKQYLATMSNGRVMATNVAWKHGGRFQLIPVFENTFPTSTESKSSIDSYSQSQSLTESKPHTVQSVQRASLKESLSTASSFHLKSMVTGQLLVIDSTIFKLNTNVDTEGNRNSYISTLWKAVFSSSSADSSPLILRHTQTNKPETSSSRSYNIETDYDFKLNSQDHSVYAFSSAVDSTAPGVTVDGRGSSRSVDIDDALTPLTTDIALEEVEEPIKGVSIGSWLIPERWMLPEFYDDVTPFMSQLCGLVKTIGIDAAEKRMKNHLDTWLTTADFDFFEEKNIRHLRLPIGYWNVISSPYYFDQGLFVPQEVADSAYYLNWFLTETSNRGMTVLLDFHAAPGSQNGWDHSGCGYDSLLGEGWNTEEHRALSLRAIRVIAQEYIRKYDHIIGIEVLNEPALDLEKNHHDDLLSYYQEAYSIIREYSEEVLIVVNVLWEPYYDAWKKELLEPEYHNVAIDWHSYGFDNLDEWERLRLVAGRQTLIAEHAKYHPIIIGEWSNYYHTSSADDQFDSAPRSFFDAQLQSYESAYGWYFWTFKVIPKEFVGWSMIDLLKLGYDFHLEN